MTTDKNIQQEKIILGIDPGTKVMGYGVIKVSNNTPLAVQLGVLRLDKYDGQEVKLAKIYERMQQLIEEFLPDELAIEAPFYGNNVQSMLKLGRAQGVAIAAAISRQIPIREYSPKSIKQSVTGNGNASKEQVAAMVQRLLKCNPSNYLLDATDALAVALCHFYQKNKPTQKSGNWSDFLKSNPEKLKTLGK
jgi:crossover junction endodeoxyribonuclease RuvC